MLDKAREWAVKWVEAMWCLDFYLLTLLSSREESNCPGLAAQIWLERIRLIRTCINIIFFSSLDQVQTFTSFSNLLLLFPGFYLV